MRKRARGLAPDIGKPVVVYLGDGTDVVTGELYAVSETDVILEETDLFGAEYIGIRHTIPWDSVYRIAAFDHDLLAREIQASDNTPEPPEWVSEVLMEIAQEEAQKGSDSD